MKIAIIGAGPGGMAAAAEAIKHNAEVTVIENDGLGGACLQRGCIPIKALIAVCKILEKHKKAANFGFTKLDAEIDYEKVFGRNEKVIKSQENAIELTFKNSKVNLIKGKAVVTGEGKIEIISVDGTMQEITADKIILAVGSVPVKPKMFDTSTSSVPNPSESTDGFGFSNKNIITSDEVLKLKDVPKEMLIVGGGVIGLEFAYIFNAFGCKVTVVEMMEHVLPGIDTELAGTLARELKKKGINILTGTKVESVAVKDGKIEIIGTEHSSVPQEKKFIVDTVLVAIGRAPNSSGLTKGVSLDLDAKGFVKVNKNFETSIPDVYAIGDLIGNPMLAHKASFDGNMAVKAMFGEKIDVDYNNVPGCIYTIPEVASVGLSEEAAKAKNINYVAKKYFNRALGIAWANEEIEGFAKILVNKDNNEIIGMHLLGTASTELIGIGAVAVKNKLKITDIADSIFPHPTFSENIYEAANN